MGHAIAASDSFVSNNVSIEETVRHFQRHQHVVNGVNLMRGLASLVESEITESQLYVALATLEKLGTPIPDVDPLYALNLYGGDEIRTALDYDAHHPLPLN